MPYLLPVWLDLSSGSSSKCWLETTGSMWNYFLSSSCFFFFFLPTVKPAFNEDKIKKRKKGIWSWKASLNSYFSFAEIKSHLFFCQELSRNLESLLLRCDQKSGERNVKVFSIILKRCCETDFLQRLTRIGHLSVPRWLADISPIKPTWVSHLIDCSAFFLFCCCLQDRHSC